MGRKHKFKVDDKLYIKFLDHSIGGSYCTCEVIGWLLGEDENAYNLTFWKVVTEDKKTFEANLEPFNILKCAIKEVRKL